MLPNQTSYIFLELSLIAFILGFGWEHLTTARLLNYSVRKALIFQACIWVGIDYVATTLGLWSFPAGGTLPIRIFSLPPEEYLFFLLHALLCLILMRQFSSSN